MTTFTLTLILFLIMNPVGHVNFFVYTLMGIETKRARQIVFRELCIALFVMLFFDLIGESLFWLLQISDVTIYLASGIVLFLGAINILFPGRENGLEPRAEIPKTAGEPFLVPLAIPMIAGPALLATIMLYAVSEPNPLTSIFAVLISWLVAACILLNARQLLHFVGASGLTACEKLMGMVLVLLAVQRFMEGILMLYQKIHNV